MDEDTNQVGAERKGLAATINNILEVKIKINAIALCLPTNTTALTETYVWCEDFRSLSSQYPDKSLSTEALKTDVMTSCKPNIRFSFGRN